VARLCTGIYTELHMQCGGYLGMQPYSLNLHHPCYRKKSDAHLPLSSSHLVSSRYVNVGGFFFERCGWLGPRLAARPSTVLLAISLHGEEAV
jgi:hypothetical protein